VDSVLHQIPCDLKWNSGYLFPVLLPFVSTALVLSGRHPYFRTKKSDAVSSECNWHSLSKHEMRFDIRLFRSAWQYGQSPAIMRCFRNTKIWHGINFYIKLSMHNDL